jgi:predicted metal-dependent hydrolase
MPIVTDEEFGKVTVRRSARASQVRIRVAPDGTLRASLPLYAPLFLVKRLLKSSRDELRTMLNEHRTEVTFTDGMLIGKSHTLVVRPTTQRATTVERHGQQIIVSLPTSHTLDDHHVVEKIRTVMLAALRIEARSYLPKRLKFLAEQLGYSYSRIRFSHASGRWGSCSTSGTISLNIALMKLPFELIDYVLIHELSHTKQMNHSPEFWQLVAQGDPAYKQHRSLLKNETTSM